MRILGIDPGYGRVGWGIIANEPELRLIKYGCIHTSKTKSLVQRYHQIEIELNSILDFYEPDVAGVEALFFGRNTTTAMNVSEARGVILLALHKAGIDKVYEPKPSQIKSAIGYGKAEKKQIQVQVKRLLGLSTIPRPDDAADALAIAYYVESIARLDELIACT